MWTRQKPPPGAAHINWSHPLAQGLVLYWPLNAMAGATAYDVARADHGGLQVDATWAAAPWGAAINFKADDVDARVWNTRQVLNLTVVTVATRIRPTAVRTNSEFAGCANGYGSGTFDKVLGYDASSQLKWLVYDGGTKTATDTVAASAGTTYSVAGTADGTTARLYRDGREVGSVAAGATYAGYTVPNVFVGYRGSGAGNGLLADYMAIWSRALPAGLVAWLHAEPYAFLVQPRRRPMRHITLTARDPQVVLGGLATAQTFVNEASGRVVKMHCTVNNSPVPLDINIEGGESFPWGVTFADNVVEEFTVQGFDGIPEDDAQITAVLQDT